MAKRMRRSVTSLVVFATYSVVGSFAFPAHADARITTTRPVSDASFTIDGAGITTTRPVSDATFLVGGTRTGITTTRPMSDAGFIINAPAASAPIAGVETTSAPRSWAPVTLLVVLLALMTAALYRQRRRTPAV